MGVDSANRLYAGRIVTFRPPLRPVGVSAKNEARENVYMQGFIKRFKPFLGQFQSGGINVFFNYGDEITRWLKRLDYKPEDLVVENPLVLEEDVCDTAHICSESGTTECIFRSKRLLIAGKIIGIRADDDGYAFGIFLRPTGLRY